MSLEKIRESLTSKISPVLENNYETKITPTFVFFKEKEEIGRIIGYSSAEMFWWQVDEILDRD